MKLGDIVQLMQPWTRLRISGLTQVDKDGCRIWTETLTEAQKLAYWDRTIFAQTIEENTMTVYCVLVEE